jgi:hypothetical protein
MQQATTQQLTNRKLLITLMEYVGKLEKAFHKELFDLSDFQTGKNYKLSKTKAQVVKCGTKCCISGWVAICPAFKEQGVRQGSYIGEALLGDLDATQTMERLLGIDHGTANNLIFLGDYGTGDYSDVTLKDVISYVKSWGKDYAEFNEEAY